MERFRRFRDRDEAGAVLGRAVADALDDPVDVIVLGLPRGGVPVAAGVAEILDAPLDVFVVRKLGVPGHEELAMGAIGPGGVRVLNEGLIRELRVSAEAIERTEARERAELERREIAYRGTDAPIDLTGRHVVLVDDGVATGASMMAAFEAVKILEPRAVTIAVPVASAEAVEMFTATADACVVCEIPDPFLAVGYWYADFTQTTDAEVRSALER